MARHTRRRPRNRQERERANERAAKLLEALEQQASEARELAAAARQAEKKLRERLVRHVDARELDISEMAQATGISRQTIHRLLRARRRPQPQSVVGQGVDHPSREAIEKVGGPALPIRLDHTKQLELPLDAGIVCITPA